MRGHADHDRVVAAQDQVDQDDLEDARNQFAGEVHLMEV